MMASVIFSLSLSWVSWSSRIRPHLGGWVLRENRSAEDGSLLLWRAAIRAIWSPPVPI